MKKVISFVAVFVLVLSLIATTAFAATAYNAVEIYEDGRDGLKQWTVMFEEKGYVTAKVENLVSDINNYCKDNKCSVEEITYLDGVVNSEYLVCLVTFKK